MSISRQKILTSHYLQDIIMIRPELTIVIPGWLWLLWTRADHGQSWCTVTVQVYSDCKCVQWLYMCTGVTRADHGKSWFSNSWSALVPLDKGWPGQALVDFGYLGPELTMANPGWLWSTSTKVTKSPNLGGYHIQTSDQEIPGQVLVGFGYPGPELTRASPGWLGPG